ncbi:MAG TPA: glycoside hydrolase family 30 protein [Haloplasmataceae bacterium]
MVVRIVRTAKNTGDRLKEIQKVEMTKDFNLQIPLIALNPEEEYQTHIGFGGAFTEAACYTLSEISDEKRHEVLKAYFDPNDGLGYTLGRVHINSCDFALENYTYVDEGDVELKTFDLSREDQWVVPTIQDAMKIRGGELKLLASPWSPCPWMKTNKEMNYGGHLDFDYAQVWANYYVKYIEEMKKRGINITWVSVQNEPAAIQTWDSCIYTAEQERDFVKYYLGPTLERSGLRDVGIIIWDHNRDLMVERAATVLMDEEANRYVWGVGNHWYVSEQFENLSVVHHMFPDKHLIFTEGCVERGPHPDSWQTGEKYGRNIIGDFNNWSEAFIDWNLVLNEMGGPNHVGNYCDAPILIDRNTNEIIYNSSYYYIGHFSKYIRPGAVRIGLAKNTPDGVYATAFKNTDGTVVLVVQNERGHLVHFSIAYQQHGMSVVVPEHSITTFIIE